ncbi:MAG: CDP-alcohol phosphatidyltransferase family protein [Candidatus Pacebacteria bacterium]|nr:CDP-alcohol phosphatidyltransferase family protein [Candidatus Paceibacterota bacterium]
MRKIFFNLLKESMRDMRIASPTYFRKVTRTDRLIKFVILRFIPRWITPNHVTVIRFMSVPILIALVLGGYTKVATVVFILSALSDAIDGALARTRNRITKWGIVNDPLADKLLVGSMVAIMVSKYIHPILAFVIIGLEIVIFAGALYRTKEGGIIVPAKWVGKIKMVVESVALGLIFIFAITGISHILFISTLLFYAAIFFAVLSVFVYKSI